MPAYGRQLISFPSLKRSGPPDGKSYVAKLPSYGSLLILSPLATHHHNQGWPSASCAPHITHNTRLDTQPSRFQQPVCKASRPLPFGSSASGTHNPHTPNVEPLHGTGCVANFN